MYSTCIFCSHSLGANREVEHFPVGRKLAFDAARGRLWAVCVRCGRWNLTPLDERWEAIEECERLFERAALRVSTEHVGLARVGDGTELVRVGERVVRPELAAWRYGERFARRKRRALGIGVPAAALGLASVAIPGIGFVGGMIAGTVISGSVMALSGAVPHWVRVAAVAAPDAASDAAPVELRGKELNTARLRVADERWRLEIRRGRTLLRFDGDDARRALGAILPALNWTGGSAAQVSDAVRAVERAGSAEAYFAATAAAPKEHGMRGFASYPVATMPRAVKLALEMAAHEETERRALEGELAELEEAWRNAEEIAAIADDMLLPATVHGWLARLKR